MGTNYYWVPRPPCEACGRPHEPIHIGKSSGGWCFALHVMPEIGIRRLADWKVRFDVTDSRIVDEYGREINKYEMLKIITEREHYAANEAPTRKWLIENHAELGPGGLVRAEIDMVHCVGHGDIGGHSWTEETWDLILGEFS